MKKHPSLDLNENNKRYPTNIRVTYNKSQQKFLVTFKIGDEVSQYDLSGTDHDAAAGLTVGGADGVDGIGDGGDPTGNQFDHYPYRRRGGSRERLWHRD